jgi:hypothetical protein
LKDRLYAEPAAHGVGSDLEVVARAAERVHRQPLGIPAIRLAAGSLGTSKITDTFRDPHIGHFNRASKLVIGKPPPPVQVSVCRSSSALPKHPRTLFMASRRPQAYLT